MDIAKIWSRGILPELLLQACGCANLLLCISNLDGNARSRVINYSNVYSNVYTSSLLYKKKTFEVFNARAHAICLSPQSQCLPDI